MAVLGLVSSLSARVAADSILFSTNPTPDGAMAMASHPGVGGKIEIEAADDFFTATPVQINSATFTGLLVPSTTGQTPNVGEVVAKGYSHLPAQIRTKTRSLRECAHAGQFALGPGVRQSRQRVQ